MDLTLEVMLRASELKLAVPLYISVFSTSTTIVGAKLEPTVALELRRNPTAKLTVLSTAEGLL